MQRNKAIPAWQPMITLLTRSMIPPTAESTIRVTSMPAFAKFSANICPSYLKYSNRKYCKFRILQGGSFSDINLESAFLSGMNNKLFDSLAFS